MEENFIHIKGPFTLAILGSLYCISWLYECVCMAVIRGLKFETHIMFSSRWNYFNLLELDTILEGNVVNDNFRDLR